MMTKGGKLSWTETMYAMADTLAVQASYLKRLG